MNINEEKTKINFYSLESFEYGDNKNYLKSFTLYDLKISSKEANFKFENQSFNINFPILSKEFIKLVKPLEEEIKLIENNKISSQKNNSHKKKFNYFPTLNWKISVYFQFNIDDIIRLFYITDFKSFFNQNLKCELFFYLKKFDYYGEFSNKFVINKKFSLFIFKNFNDELDNLKFDNLVLKVKINYLNLLHMLSFNLFKDKWFLNNKIYSKNISIISNEIKSISELIENKYEFNCIWTLLNLVSYRVITYYGLLKMLNKSMRKFLKEFEKFNFILKTICLDVFKENIQDYKMNSDELFNYIEENFKKSLKIKIKNEINNLIINNITCFIPYPSKEFFSLNYLDSIQKTDMKKDIINLKFRGYNENENLYIKDKFIEAYIIRILKKGINNIYQFFGYSEYQFYDLSCYFIKKKSKIPLNKLILINSGKLLDYKKQYFILFNPIINTFPIQNEKIIRKDTQSNKESNESSNLSCNKISKTLLNEIIKKRNKNTSYIIALCDGYYGIWNLINDHKGNIYIGSSKFIQTHNNLFLYEISNPRRILLNYQFIRPLLRFIKNHKIFTEIFQNHINKLNYPFSFLKLNNNSIEQLIEFYSNIRFKYQDQFILRLHESLYNLNKKILKEEGFLYLKNSYILRGVFDYNKHHQKLKPGYIYVKISPNNNPNDRENCILKGKGLLFKYPNNSKDYKFQKINFSKSYKTNLVNVIVFSSEEKNLFKNLDISDLSIENFLLIWDKKIIDNCNFNELNNIKYNNENNNNNVTFDDIYQDFCYSNKYKQKSMVNFEKENQIINNIDIIINKYLNDLCSKLKYYKENKNNSLFLDYKSLIHNFMKINGNLSKEQFFFLKHIVFLIPLLIDFINSLYTLLLKYNISNLEYLLASNFNEQLITKNLGNIPNNFISNLNDIMNKLKENIIPDTKFENKNNYYNEMFIYSCICYNLFYHYEIIESIINSNRNIIEIILENEEEDVNIQYKDFEYEIQSLGFDFTNYYNNIELIIYEKILSNKIKNTFFDNLLLLKSYIKDKRLCSIPYLFFYKYIFLLKNI